MRLRSYWVLALLFLTLPGSFRAQSTSLTLDDAVLKAGSTLAPENLPRLGWIPGTDRYVYLDKKDGTQKMMTATPAAPAPTLLFSLPELNELLKKEGAEALVSLGPIQFLNASTAWFTTGGAIFTYDWAAKKLTLKAKYPADIAENVEIGPSLAVSWTQENNIWVYDAAKGAVPVTMEKDKGIVHGTAAHRNEFGINKGMFWSPSGKKLAFYRIDQRKVTDYPVLDLTKTPATAKMVKYPMAGQTSHFATVGVYDVATGAYRFLKQEGAPDHYSACITWTPDEKYLIVAELNRDQNDLAVNLYDANTFEKVRELFREKSDKYVEPKYDPIFLPGKPNEFLWQSQRDGYNHLYHYNTDGTLLGQLTQGPWIVTSVLGFGKDNKTLYFTSTQDSPVERHAYLLDLKSKKISRLTEGKGTHAVQMSAGNFLLDNYTSTTIPRIIRLIDPKGKQVAELLKAANPLAAFNLGEIRLFTLKAEDGTDLWCRMFLPPNFNEDQTYPVLDYVYGGPGVQLITDSWLGGAPLWFHYAAQQGYIVFTLENRGSANRGLAFEQATFRQLGTVEIADQLKGVDYLKSFPNADKSRMAIHGWSFGGFMTTSLMLRAPGIFKVGVAGGPVIDWRMYEVMYTERYMDTPETNPEGYKKADLLNYVQELKGKLMLIHGTSDDVVVWQHSLNFLEKCVTEGVQVDYFVYPGHEHNVVGPDRLHLIRKIFNYIDEELKR